MSYSRRVTRSTLMIAGFGLLSASALAAGIVVHNQQTVSPMVSIGRVTTAPQTSSPQTSSGPNVVLAGSTVALAQAATPRPLYDLNLRVNYNLLTWDDTARITVPDQGETLRDVVFFLYANADGVGGATRQHPNVQVDSVTLGGQKLTFVLDGAVMHVQLPQPQRGPFTLEFVTHGVVPRAPEGAGGLMDMLGGGGDLTSALGGQTPTGKDKDKNTDYGLYTFGTGILSLGSFWYPALAVRQNGKWVDDAPEGLGDVCYSVMNDFDVSISTANNVQIAATGKLASPVGAQTRVYQARDVRDFALLMSQDWIVSQKMYDVSGKPVRVTAYTLKKDAAQSARVIDITGHALQIYGKRFGPYIYDDFKVVQGPIRAGAGGMEFSGMTSIAQGLYGDMQKELGGLANSLGATMGGGGGPDAKALKDLLGDDGDDAGAAAAAPGGGGQGDDTGNPAQDMLNGMMGGQAAMLNSLLEETVAHEVGHQWWAMAVGSDSLRSPWLDEALTNYSSMVYFEDRYGAAKAAEMRDIHLKQTYSMARMMGAPDGPANLKTADYSNNLQYGALIYGKAALFYQALREKIGDAAFFGALRDYYRDETDRLATADDLLAHFEQRAPDKKAAIRALYQRWILGSHGDEDVAGGKISGIGDMLGGLMGGGMEGGDE